MNNFYKSIMILSIKYLPAILALSTAWRIFFINIHKGDTMNYIEPVHWINSILTLLGILATYCAGVYLGFCWRHKHLCYVAAGGVLAYMLTLLFDVKASIINEVCIIYTLAIVILVIIYYFNNCDGKK